MGKTVKSRTLLLKLQCVVQYLPLNIHDDCIIQLELCAFALKGEHNVYSLVPNIAVCMYIYIDTKFSYDNNVYFSIFCEHRQLKHVVLCG